MHERKYFSRNIIPNMSKKIKNFIVESIGDSFFSLTSDGWQKIISTPALIRLLKILK